MNRLRKFWILQDKRSKRIKNVREVPPFHSTFRLFTTFASTHSEFLAAKWRGDRFFRKYRRGGEHKTLLYTRTLRPCICSPQTISSSYSRKYCSYPPSLSPRKYCIILSFATFQYSRELRTKAVEVLVQVRNWDSFATRSPKVVQAFIHWVVMFLNANVWELQSISQRARALFWAADYSFSPQFMRSETLNIDRIEPVQARRVSVC